MSVGSPGPEGMEGSQRPGSGRPPRQQQEPPVGTSMSGHRDLCPQGCEATRVCVWKVPSCLPVLGVRAQCHKLPGEVIGHTQERGVGPVTR